MKIRFLLATRRPTASGGQYQHIHFVGEYDPTQWKSEKHMIRSFRNKAKRHLPEVWNDPSREIRREEILP